jgi:GNAT superfamily N-acetyltransferase
MSEITWNVGEGMDYAPYEALEELGATDPLSGPFCAPDDVVISSVFGKYVDQIMADAGREMKSAVLSNPLGLDHSAANPLHDYIEDRLSPQEAILISEDETFRIVSLLDEELDYQVGLVALEKVGDGSERIRGILYGFDVSVCLLHQRQGIGSALVAAELLTEGELKVWQSDKPGYSPAGAKAVKKGFSLAVELAQPHFEIEEVSNAYDPV